MEAGQSPAQNLDILCSELHKLSQMAEPDDKTDRTKRRVLILAVIDQRLALLAFGRLFHHHTFSELKQTLYKTITNQNANTNLTACTDARCTRCFVTRRKKTNYIRPSIYTSSSSCESDSHIQDTHHRRTLYGVQGR